MIKVYKFDTFTSYIVDSDILSNLRNVSNIPYPIRSKNWQRDVQWVVPIPKTIETLNITEKDNRNYIDIKSLLNTSIPTFDFNSKLFLHSNCTIPRVKVTQKYTRVLNANKADICVVPTPSNSYNTISVAIFLNNSKGKIYIVRNPFFIEDNDTFIEFCKQYPLGTTVTTINPSLKSFTKVPYFKLSFTSDRQENFLDLLDAKLIYCGRALYLSPKDKWIGDYLYNTMHNVVSEDKILATLGDSTNELTREIYNNISEMLNSKDSTVVGLGLKTLAELDYEKYHNTSTYLLQTTWRKWKDNKMKTNTSVKYMLKFLGLRNNGFARYSNSITSEDFNFLKEIIETDFSKSINSLVEDFIGKYPFAKIDCNTTFTIDINE